MTKLINWFKNNYPSAAFYSLLLIAFTLPLHLQINSLAIIILAISCLFSYKLKEILHHYLQSKTLLLLSFFYFLHVISYFLSKDKNDALFTLEQKLSILVLPFFVPITIYHYKEKLQTILTAFLLGVSIANLLALILAFADYYINRNINTFFYHDLANRIGIHAIYMAMYTAFSIWILTYYFFGENIKNKAIYYLAAIFLVLCLILLASKNITIVFILGSLLFLTYRAVKLKQYKILGAVLVVLICVFAIIFTLPITKKRFQETKFSSVSMEDGDQNGISGRLAIWKCSFDVIKDNFWIGVGTGDVNEKLYESYVKNNFTVGIDLKLNAHNQYIETFLSLGIVGVIVLVSILVLNFRIAINQQSLLYLAFIVLIASAFLTESSLNTQKGVVFFSFFISIFVSLYESTKKTNR